MPREFTAEQLRAVNTRGKDILVSAAAGSGKTAVLVERIAELNCINRLLVVTFTEDAALEMKSRLVQRLSEKSEAAASDEEQDEILRQLALVPSAHVSTIHAFCKRLLKQYFHLTDADPGARIGDKAELELISGRAMEELFEEEYAKENNADFFDLVESYGGKKTDDDKLDELIKKYFLFIESSDYPEYTALKYAAMYDGVSPGNAADVWLEPVKKEISAVLDGAEAKLQMSFSICGEPSGPLEYKKAINDDLNQIDFLRDCLNGTLHEICKAFKLLTFPTIHTYRVKDEIDPVLKNRAKNLRDSAKTDLRDLVSRFLFASAEKLTADIEALGPAVRTLTKLTLAYREKYRALKRERGLLDFNDLEHYAVSILLDGGPENPVPSAAALEISKKYNEILIDEYQDSNAVQELILWAVSGGGAVPRFMVGDLKQSVYKFRRASPEIFIGKYLSYSIDVNSCSGLKIDLNKNFRSRPAV
ncbi:MAG: UvrD-helicase domain-containing protein, partial [Defluviitaleaceae bacterium]|nr:UvrD-helicase domain-containing protein [Defluviitaleaceae bacterium]